MKHDTYGESGRRGELRPSSLANVSANVSANGHVPVPRPQPRADIQGLRALAVTMVILGHAGVPPFSGGFVGVDVFFVVSGFLISSLLLHEATESGTVRIGAFYGRRARRILPAATAVLMATSLYAGANLPLARVQDLATDARWAAVFGANVHFARLGTDYFEHDRPVSPVQHYWSLAVEEQFYLVWPLIVLAAVALLGRRSRAPLRVLTGLMAVSWLASLWWSSVLTARAPVQAYFSTPVRAWELVTGAMLALSARHLIRLPTAARHLLGAAGLAAIVLVGVAYDETTAFPGWRALIPVLGTAMVLASGASGVVGAARALTLRPVGYVGDLSYSLYLWHWPVFTLAAAQGLDRRWQHTVALFAVTALLSVLSFHVIENPIRRTRWSPVRGRRALILWPATLLPLVLVIAGAQDHATRAFEARIATTTDVPPPELGIALSTRQREPNRPESSPTAAAAPTAAQRISRALRAADRREPIAGPLLNWKILRNDVWQRHFRCYATWGETTTRICPRGDTSVTRSIVLFGDSHAGMWIPPLDRLARAARFRLIPLVKVGCGPFDVTQEHWGSPFPDCQPFRRWAIDQIVKIKPDVILLGYRGLLEVSGDGDPTRLWARGVARTLQKLTSQTPKVEVISDVTSHSRSPRECVTDPNADLASCTTPEQHKTRLGNQVTRRIARRLGAEFVDVTGLVCQRHRCPLIVDHVITYRDASHVSVTWTLVVQRELGRLLHLS